MSPDAKAFKSIYREDFQKLQSPTHERLSSPEVQKSTREQEINIQDSPHIREEATLESPLTNGMQSVTKSEFCTIDGHAINAPPRDPHKNFHDIPYLDGDEAKHFE